MLLERDATLVLCPSLGHLFSGERSVCRFRSVLLAEGQLPPSSVSMGRGNEVAESVNTTLANLESSKTW